MKKVIRNIVLVSIAVAVLISVFDYMLNPWRRPPEQIGEDILNQTPIGTSMEDVIEYVNGEEWNVIYISDMFGYETYYTYAWSSDSSNPGTEVGVKSVRAVAGQYTRFLIVKINVEVLFGFDENSELIEIAIQYSTDL